MLKIKTPTSRKRDAHLKKLSEAITNMRENNVPEGDLKYFDACHACLKHGFNAGQKDKALQGNYLLKTMRNFKGENYYKDISTSNSLKETLGILEQILGDLFFNFKYLKKIYKEF